MMPPLPDWVSVKSVDFAYYLVLRLNLRAFIGIPLCTWNSRKVSIFTDQLILLLIAKMMRLGQIMVPERSLVKSS
jgi:hypothetical protein